MVEKCEGYKIETNRNNQKPNIGFQKYLYTVLNKNSSIINELYIGNNEIVTELLISENSAISGLKQTVLRSKTDAMRSERT